MSILFAGSSIADFAIAPYVVTKEIVASAAPARRTASFVVV